MRSPPVKKSKRRRILWSIAIFFLLFIPFFLAQATFHQAYGIHSFRLNANRLQFEYKASYGIDIFNWLDICMHGCSSDFHGSRLQLFWTDIFHETALQTVPTLGSFAEVHGTVLANDIVTTVAADSQAARNCPTLHSFHPLPVAIQCSGVPGDVSRNGVFVTWEVEQAVPSSDEPEYERRRLLFESLPNENHVLGIFPLWDRGDIKGDCREQERAQEANHGVRGFWYRHQLSNDGTSRLSLFIAEGYSNGPPPWLLQVLNLRSGERQCVEIPADDQMAQNYEDVDFDFHHGQYALLLKRPIKLPYGEYGTHFSIYRPNQNIISVQTSGRDYYWDIDGDRLVVLDNSLLMFKRWPDLNRERAVFNFKIFDLEQPKQPPQIVQISAP